MEYVAMSISQSQPISSAINEAVVAGTGEVAERASRFIYITGCDGTGKTTQVNLLMHHLCRQGIEPYHVWLRFPFLLSLPLLAYARWRGYSWHEEIAFDGGGTERESVRHGYWDFGRSHLLRTLLPWTLLIDAGLAALQKIYLPLWRGKTVICERFVLDMLVDLSVAFADEAFHLSLPGRLYRRLLPRNSQIVILDLEAESIRQRRGDLRYDRQLDAKLGTFRRLVDAYGLTCVSSSNSVDAVCEEVWERVTNERR